MLIVPRWVASAPDPGGPYGTPVPQSLADLRNLPGWVLLGDPGAGKTQVLQTEAQICQGWYGTVASFLSGEDNGPLPGQGVFLDDLDEVRGVQSVLLAVGAKIKNLGMPPFRLACRTADWYDFADREAYARVALCGRLPVWHLLPLRDEEIWAILQAHPAVADPSTLIAQAKQFGLAHLLQNPQLLSLMVAASRIQRSTQTRTTVFELACRAQVDPGNRYGDSVRGRPVSTDRLLDAAGYWFAVMLLGDKTGVALEKRQASSRYATVEVCAPPDREAAQQVLQSALFVSAGNHRQRPSHRTTAEYLAARWLAQQIDQCALPPDRVLNLLSGANRKAAPGLRGFYGWLAVHCLTLRESLIQADPVTILLNADVASMSTDHKRQILQRWIAEVQQHRENLYKAKNNTAITALCDHDLAPVLADILSAPPRDERTKIATACVLAILETGTVLPELVPCIQSVATHTHHDTGCQRQAQAIWQKIHTEPADHPDSDPALTAPPAVKPAVDLSGILEEIRTAQADPVVLHELANVWLGHHPDSRGATPEARFLQYYQNGDAVYQAAASGFRRCVRRHDLPTVREILSARLKLKTSFLGQPCLIGMVLLRGDDAAILDKLTKATIKRMLAYRMTEAGDLRALWFDEWASRWPDRVTRAFANYAKLAWISGYSLMDSLNMLISVPHYQPLVRTVIPDLLRESPLHPSARHLPGLACLLQLALCYDSPELPSLFKKRIALREMNPHPRTYWLAAAMLWNPRQYENQLWSHVGSSWHRVRFLLEFLGAEPRGYSMTERLTVSAVGRLIEWGAPYAELGLQASSKTEAGRLGELVRHLVMQLARSDSAHGSSELERLLQQPALAGLQPCLIEARRELQYRAQAVTVPSLPDVVRILCNKAPASVADLQVLALTHLGTLAVDIRNGSMYQQFWNKGTPPTHKDENSCRSMLLYQLKKTLAPFGVDCQLEGLYYKDKRADLRLAHRSAGDLLIAIRGEWHEELWKAPPQVMQPDDSGGGYGIYLVLWFGGKLQKGAKDGGKRPVTSQELRQRLTRLIDPAGSHHIAIRVLDLSR